MLTSILCLSHCWGFKILENQEREPLTQQPSPITEMRTTEAHRGTRPAQGLSPTQQSRQDWIPIPRSCPYPSPILAQALLQRLLGRRGGARMMQTRAIPSSPSPSFSYSAASLGPQVLIEGPLGPDLIRYQQQKHEDPKPLPPGGPPGFGEPAACCLRQEEGR